VQLNSINTALLWPIDPSINESSRLIYISPPVCVGFDDPVADRTSVVTKPNPLLSLGEARSAKPRVTRLVNALRSEMGLTKFQGQVQEFQGEKVITAVEAANSYEYKVDRGFVYFNINGGDSWAYYHPVGSPDLVRNFKGEPNYLTRDLLPEYYREVTGMSDEGSNVRSYFAFRHFDTDQYYNGWYDSAEDRYTIAPTASKHKINDFYKQHGQPVVDFVEDWDFAFEFDNPKTISFEDKWLNKYQPTDIMRNASKGVIKIPPLCELIIRHVCNGNTEYDRFINWLAAVFQYRRITKTAWIFNGVEGTGKGVMFHNILSPIIGRAHCIAKTIESLEDSFNGYMEECVLLMLDEFRVTDSKKAKSIVAGIKNFVVEPVISVRHMRQTSRMVRNFINLIIASNEHDPMYISPTDRRFNVGVYQALRLFLSNRDIEAIETELADFAGYMLNYPINNEWLASPLENAPRKRLQDLTQTTIDECIQELRKGNFPYFLELLPSDPGKHINPDVMAYKSTLIDMYQQYKEDPLISVSRDQLHDLFHYAVGGMPVTPAKFTKLIKHRGLDIAPMDVKGCSVRGMKTKLVDVDEFETHKVLGFTDNKIRRIK